MRGKAAQALWGGAVRRRGGRMSLVPGLQADCEELLGAFQAADTVRFERFAELWRERRFHTIFYGRIRALERNKLTKKTLEVAQQYFLPPYAFQIRVGALYLLYGLYSTQLCQPKQKIRIALKDWPEIHRFQQDLINSQHYDAAYIFRTLRLARAFHFTAMPKLLNYRTKKKIQENEFKEEFKEPTNRVNSLITNDVLEELMNIHDHYQKMKCVISADKSQPDKALSLIKDDFVSTLKHITLEHQEWQQNRMKLFLDAKETDEMLNKKEEGNLLESEGSERANALARIKYKSYSAVVEASKSRRHRQVKLESSESGSNYGKSPGRSKKTSRRPQLARKGDSLGIKGVPLQTLTRKLREEQVNKLFTAAPEMSKEKKMTILPKYLSAGEMQVARETVTQHIGMPIIAEENSDEEEVSLPKRRRRC